MNRVESKPQGPITDAGFARVRGLLQRAIELLEIKGCKIIPCQNDLFIVLYPICAIRQELSPRTEKPRYSIVFPDGSEFEEVKITHQNAVALFARSIEEKAFLHGEV